MLRRFVCLSLLLSLAGFISAQTTGPTSVIKDVSAVALAQKALAAMGGDMLKGYQDSTVTGSMTYYGSAGSLTVPVTLKSKGKSKLRTEIQQDAGTDVSISDGSNGCMTLASGSKLRSSATDLWTKRVDHIPALSLLAEYASSNMNVQYGGTATVNGSLTDEVALSFSVPSLPNSYDSLKLTQHVFYIDRATGLVTKIQFYRTDSGSSTPYLVEMYFSNYQMVSGIAVPFKRSLYIEGKLNTDLVLTSVAFNTSLPDSDFALNCGGAR
jgi:outer membrane lipoprotein-sorting protein